MLRQSSDSAREGYQALNGPHELFGSNRAETGCRWSKVMPLHYSWKVGRSRDNTGEGQVLHATPLNARDERLAHDDQLGEPGLRNLTASAQIGKLLLARHRVEQLGNFLLLPVAADFLVEPSREIRFFPCYLTGPRSEAAGPDLLHYAECHHAF